jgi:ribosomal protein S18 acetylase RimI-like enzyme
VNIKEHRSKIFHEKVAITQLTRQFTTDLMKHSYFSSAHRRGDVLNHGLRYETLKAIKLFPHATRLVAYQPEKKIAIGFLYLEENTDWLYTIEYVFVDPKYRKMGLATKLINYAVMLAKEKGARKVNLSVDYRSSRAINLYAKLGFRQIGCTLLAQKFLLGSPLSRFMKRTILGQGCLTKLALGRKSRLVELKTNSRRNKNALLSIYRQCMGRQWVEFFETNDSSIINGSRHVWQPPFFRNVLINDLANSFALIFNSPFSSKTTVELYSTSKTIIPCVLKDLLRNLTNRGVSFLQINFFNLSDKSAFKWFEEKGMSTFKFIVMGKDL